MNLLKSYIQNFLNRAGSYVFVATVLSRILSFLASWIALKFIENKELGVVLFAYNIIAFIVPLSGLGLHQSLIRYGALTTNLEEKENLFRYTFKKGILASFGLIILINTIGYFFPFDFKNTYKYLVLLSFLIVTTYVFGLVKTQFRLNHNNRLFAYSEIVYNVILVISVFILSYYFTEIGYISALVLSPLAAFFVFYKKLKIKKINLKKSEFIDLKFWKYGFFASLSNVATQLLFIIDIFLIGYLLKDAEMVTNYRYVSIIPFSLLFLPRVFISTDFVAFTEKIFDKNYIIKYAKSYMLLFLILSLILCFFTFLFSEQILTLFDKNFVTFSDSFKILMIGICGVLIFRGLFGNLLSSLGKAHVNYYIASAALLLNVISNYYLIPEIGLKGAAITSAALMWFTGLVSFVWFVILYKKELKTNV